LFGHARAGGQVRRFYEGHIFQIVGCGTYEVIFVGPKQMGAKIFQRQFHSAETVIAEFVPSQSLSP
jgi:hypothetical protein